MKNSETFKLSTKVFSPKYCCYFFASGSFAGTLVIPEPMELIYFENGDRMKLIFEVSSANHDEYEFFGINEPLLSKLRDEQITTPSLKRGKPVQNYIEIPAVGIRSKYCASWNTFISGDGFKVTKSNFGTAQFIIVAMLWTSNNNLFFLVAETGEFNGFAISANKTKQGRPASYFFSFYHLTPTQNLLCSRYVKVTLFSTWSHFLKQPMTKKSIWQCSSRG